MKTVRQMNLFGEIEPLSLTTEESANRIGISTATIRNWIKTGYLVPAGSGKVTIESIEHFQNEVAGKEKLNQRANKSLKDSHDLHEISERFLSKIRLNEECDGDLGTEYENSLSDSYRNKEGVYYTPLSIVNDLFNISTVSINEATFCDPCCGSGNFIARALSLGFKPRNIYGFDVDPVAVELTKKRIYDISGFDNSNIKVADFFDVAVLSNSKEYDYIFTNPPWGKKIDKKVKEEIGNILNARTSLDTCSLFLFACLKSLKTDGVLGLLLPEAFFNISTFAEARLCALNYYIQRLIDYGKPFKGLVTKAQGIVLLKKPRQQNDFVSCSSSDHTFKREISSFLENPKSILNLYCSNEDAKVMSYLLSIPHITLKNRARWGLGIVTGNNKKFIKDKETPNLIPIFKGSDIISNGFKLPSCFIPSDLSLYQQVAPSFLFQADEKLIYKFISSKLCFVHDTQKRYILNSANMLIPHVSFPVKARVLCDFLNSDLMNWFFTNLFNTHKVLRGDLETLPIHAQFLTGEHFVESEFLDKLSLKRTGDGTFRIKR